jgi:ribosomal protein S18 acetylase RimI-like enzyme
LNGQAVSDGDTLQDTVDIPGLRFRPAAGPADGEALMALRLACAAHDGLDPLSVAESLPTRQELDDWLAAPEVEERAILAEIDGLVVGYNRIADWTEADGMAVWLILGWVLPEWRGRGLGTALLRRAERRVRDLTTARPDRWEFAANASSTETEATALLLDNGYAAGYTVLEMGLDWGAFAPSTVSPDGIRVRPGRVEDAPRIAASIGESYRDEYEHGRYSENFNPQAYAADLAGPPYDPALWRVAWAGDEVAGQVLPYIENGRAVIDEVSVRPAWRQRGLARALLSAALLGLREREVEVVRLDTVAEFRTRAVDLYRSLGFRVLKEFPRYRKSP